MALHVDNLFEKLLYVTMYQSIYLCINQSMIFCYFRIPRIIPETARWLFAHDRIDEATNALFKYGTKKEKPIERDDIKQYLISVQQSEKAKIGTDNKKYSPLDLFRTPKLRKRTFILCLDW